MQLLSSAWFVYPWLVFDMCVRDVITMSSLGYVFTKFVYELLLWYYKCAVWSCIYPIAVWISIMLTIAVRIIESVTYLGSVFIMSQCWLSWFVAIVMYLVCVRNL